MIIYLTENKTNKITAYHGSEIKIKDFSYEYVGTREANDQYGSGFYFYTDSSLMFNYGKYAHVCNLILENVIHKGGNPNLKNMKKLANALPTSIKKDIGADWNENWKIGFNEMIQTTYESSEDEYDGYLNIWIDAYRDNFALWTINMKKILNIDAFDAGNGILVVFNKKSIEIQKILVNNEL